MILHISLRLIELKWFDHSIVRVFCFLKVVITVLRKYVLTFFKWVGIYLETGAVERDPKTLIHTKYVLTLVTIRTTMPTTCNYESCLSLKASFDPSSDDKSKNLCTNHIQKDEFEKQKNLKNSSPQDEFHADDALQRFALQ